MLSSDIFFDTLLTRFYQKLHEFPSENYDYQRHSADGIDRSRFFAVDAHKRFFQFVLSRTTDLFQTWSWLEDQQSRELFLDVLLYRLLGHLHVKLPSNNPFFHESRKRDAELVTAPSQLSCRGFFGGLKHYDAVPFNGEFIALDAGGISTTFMLRQYHYSSTSGFEIGIHPGDIVIDAGACFGDTGLGFASSTGKNGMVYCFEMLNAHIDVIAHNMGQNPQLARRIRVIRCGLSDSSNAIPEGGIGSHNNFNQGFSVATAPDETVPLRSIDDLVDQGRIERVDFIKMDIEGYEHKALQGAQNTIRRFQPRLAICVYHCPEDLTQIPRLIKNIDQRYQLYLGHYSIHAEETVLYAVIPREHGSRS